MNYNLQRLKIYKLRGINLPKSRRVDEILFSKDYKINNNTYNIESKISDNIDTYIYIYYARMVLSDILLTGFLRNEKNNSSIETLEKRINNEIKKCEISNKSNQLYIVYKVTQSTKLKKLERFRQIGKYLCTMQEWPEVNDSFKNESEQIINSTIAFVNSLMMNWYCRPELEKFKDFVFYEDTSKQIIYDFYLEGGGNAYSSSKFDGRKLLKIKKKAKKISNNIKDFYEIDRLYVKMIEESDPLKKFLFGYFCIEIIINKTYALKSNILKMEKNLGGSTKIQLNKELANLLSKRLTNIRDKFIINSALIWEGIASNDHNDFIEIQNIRNKISHGNFDMLNALPIPKVEALMSKLVENYHKIKN